MRTLVASCALIAMLACATAPAPAPPADVVLRAGRVFTGDAARPWVSAVAWRGDRVVALGSDADVQPLVGAATEVIELHGRTVLPGLHDAHVHPLGAGREQQGCPLSEAKSVDDILARVRACAAARPGDGWIVGRGWDLSLFPQANPHKRLLDAAVPARPVYLEGADGHSGWLNGAGLAKAGIGKDTPNPANGVIERDADGTPSGTVREAAAALVEDQLPEPTLDDDVRALGWAVARLHAAGITSIMDASVDERRLAAWQALASKGELALRGVACIGVEPTDATAALEHARALRSRFADLPLAPSCAKIFLDGVLEGETAALLEPYLDRPDHRGTLNATQAQLDKTVALLEADGFAVHVHVIGDGAARAALDAFAAATATNGKAGRHRTLAHLQLVHPDDAPRFAALDVTANAQSLWAYPDSYIREVNLPQVGQERVDRMYPWGTLVRAGASVVGGSDWPVTTVNPLEAIEVMVRRQDPALVAGPVLGKGEELALEVALGAYTAAAARLFGHADEVGALRPGARADLVVLDAALSAERAADISDAKVWRTYVDGRAVYRADGPAVPQP
ncbi:MAG: amidohydrolase family protein [Deltaproteobacteria bacterium]|nr:amidohydrolase family protein [Deltaproteobacteria bacterium]